MASAPRETVFAALYSLLLSANWAGVFSTEGGIQNSNGRDFRSWQQLEGIQQPAMYLQEMPQKADQSQAFGLNKWTYQAACWVYFRRDNSVTATRINNAIDAVDLAILPTLPRGMKQTLAQQNGGTPLVTNVRITEVMFDEGFSDPQGGQVIVRIGLEILTSS